MTDARTEADRLREQGLDVESVGEIIDRQDRERGEGTPPHEERHGLTGPRAFVPARLEQYPTHPLQPGIFDRRFLEKVEVDPNGCWLWIAAKLPNGYGRYCLGGRRNSGYAHRFAYEQAKGPIPAGMEVCHICDQPSCVNPDHLFAGTRRDNIRDMIQKGRAHWQVNPERHREFGRTGGITQRGQLNSRSKLSDQDVEIIRYLGSRGAFWTDIAKVFSVKPSTISGILNGRARNAN